MGKIAPSVVLVLVGYLLGSIPTAYLVGRWVKGIDLRRYGSGTVSGSGVYDYVARLAIVPVGLFDIGKAALPAWLGLHTGLGVPVAAAAGLAAAIGHNWPVFLRFTGGRGLSCFLGMWLVFYPWGALLLLLFLAVGRLVDDSAPWALTSVALMPAFAWLARAPEAAVPLGAAMLLLMLVKRLEANRRPLPALGPERLRALLCRLAFDRDIASHDAWLNRGSAS